GGAGGGGHGAAAPDASRRSPISPMVIRRAAAASPRLGVGASGAEGERQGGWARLSPIRPAATDHAESSTRRRLAVRRPRRRRAPLRSEAVNKDCQHREKLRPEPRRSQGEALRAFGNALEGPPAPEAARERPKECGARASGPGAGAPSAPALRTGWARLAPFAPVARRPGRRPHGRRRLSPGRVPGWARCTASGCTSSHATRSHAGGTCGPGRRGRRRSR
ncbi:unnamed protein product, partial [Prorocentrum cordatum]